MLVKPLCLFVQRMYQNGADTGLFGNTNDTPHRIHQRKRPPTSPSLSF